MPSVTVIVPLYNKGRFVERALNSISSQTYSDFEVVVVDDGSSDDGPEVVEQYRDSRIRLIRQENAGPGSARNRGIKESDSPLVAFLDADDEWLPEFLEVSYQHLRDYPTCAMSVVSPVVGSEKRDWPTSNGFEVAKGPWRLRNDMEPAELRIALFFVHSGGALTRRSVLTRFGGYYENRCNYGEDSYLWLQVFLNYSVFRDPTPLFWWHTEDSDLSADSHRASRHLRPWLTDPDHIRVHCPSSFRELLERFLAHDALYSAHEKLYFGDELTARGLLERFPLMRDWKWEFAKLQMKLAFPQLYMQLMGVKKQET